MDNDPAPESLLLRLYGHEDEPQDIVMGQQAASTWTLYRTMTGYRPMDDFAIAETDKPVRSRPRFLRALRTGERSGQAIVEFVTVSVAFLSIVFGTIDLGRAVYMYSELSNAVREGARYGKMNPADSANIKETVIDKAPSLDGVDESNNALLTVDEPVCTNGCFPGYSDVTVSASYRFTPILTNFLDVGEIVLKSSASTGTR